MTMKVLKAYPHRIDVEASQTYDRARRPQFPVAVTITREEANKALEFMDYELRRANHMKENDLKGHPND